MLKVTQLEQDRSMRLETQREEQICKGRQVIRHIGSHRGRINSAWEIPELDDVCNKGFIMCGEGGRALLAGRTAHTYSEMGTGLTQGAHAKLGPTSEPLCTLFPVLEAPFPQMSAWLAISPPSDLCLNVTSSGKPSLLTLCKIASLSPCRILPFCFAL